ncbi:Charged multivesicular body protein 3, partial [Physocladia obscura]
METIFGLFKKVTPEEQVKKWRQSIRTQERELDRQIRGIDTEEAKVKKIIQAAAKRNDVGACRTLAKEIVRSRKAKDRLYTSKAQLNSLQMQLQQQLATAKIAGSLKQSTDIMKLVNNLVKLPEIQQNMMEMGKEMMKVKEYRVNSFINIFKKAGIIGEMMDDAIDNLDEEGVEEEADAEVDNILNEITKGILVGAGKVGTAPLETSEPAAQIAVDEDDDDGMEQRLAALRADNNITYLIELGVDITFFTWKKFEIDVFGEDCELMGVEGISQDALMLEITAKPDKVDACVRCMAVLRSPIENYEETSGEEQAVRYSAAVDASQLPPG